MSFKIKGEYNTATVQTKLEKEECETEAIEQIERIVNHPAFEGDDNIVIQPDFHWGAGCVIGFTMPLNDKVVPNTVGVDVGCSMYWAYLDGVEVEQWGDKEWALELDEKVRNVVPMGRHTRNKPAMHIVNEFPWDVCEDKLDNLLMNIGYTREDTPDWFTGYGGEYFKELCSRVGNQKRLTNRAIMSLGTLGGGNHFVEFVESKDTGNVGLVIHSGSRQIGLKIAKYWQQKAHENTFKRNNTVEIPDNEAKYFGLESGGEYKPTELDIKPESVREDYDGEAIEGKFGQLKQYLNVGKDNKDELDWLEGKEAIGYYIDMIFAQTYAYENREIMAEEIVDVLDATIKKSGQSIHNYIDFNDCIIRKGSTPAHEGQIAVIPYNMKEGTIVVEGKGNPNWNYSAPHGAGRIMSRTQAKNELSEENVKKEMEGIVTTNIPLDEAPGSYKDTELIEKTIKPTAEIVDRFKVLHNLKA